MNDATPRAMRLEAGAMLPDAVERAADALGMAFGDAIGFGRLRWVELTFGDGRTPVRIKGPLELLDLKARIRRAGDARLADYVCTLARLTDNGVEVLGGGLARAEVEFVELSLTPLELAAVEPACAARAEVQAPRPPRDLPLPVPQPPAIDERWAAALAESRRAERLASLEVDEGARPERGDVVNHRQFGRCTVVKIDDEHVSLRKPDGRVVQLGLTVLRFTPAGREDKHAVFDVEVARGA
ncbi:MAG: hypothetical protein PHU25_06795 [Deltaproteobacteria bacterium]|nr:hypothetical protein [Deltaproteobacteria bacterium]